MVQTLIYGAQKQGLTQELTLRIGHLAEYVKAFHKSIYRLLVLCYEAHPGKNLVDSICKYIMKGQPEKKEYGTGYPHYQAV